MMFTKQLAAPALAILVTATGCGMDIGQTSQAASVAPITKPKNFVSDNICYDICPGAQGDLREFKIDPPADYNDGWVDFDLSDNGQSLDFGVVSDRVTISGVVVKGGDGFNIYAYCNGGTTGDTGLVAPSKNSKLPAISHYNVCYEVAPDDSQGCTPGYWRNHPSRWAGVAGTDDFDATFGVDAFSPNISLAVAVNLGGGGVNALARHATAALLNAHGGNNAGTGTGAPVDYAYNAEQVIAMVQAALGEGGDVEGTKDALAAANEAGCPLSGTSN
jgi:hypothetical protein